MLYCSKCKKMVELFHMPAGDSKWATIQAYYCVFHAAEALVFLAGYREKNKCLRIALEHFYLNTNKLEPSFLINFKECLTLRMDADYGLIYSDVSAKRVVKLAEEFLQKTKELVGKR